MKIGRAIEKQDKVQAIIVFLAVVQLANFTKKVGAIEVQQIIVQATGWDKVDKLKPATIGLDAFTQYMQCAASAQFAGQSLQERRPGIALVLLLELLPFFGLCGINEIEDIFGNRGREPYHILLIGAYDNLLVRRSPVSGYWCLDRSIRANTAHKINISIENLVGFAPLSW